MEGNPSDGLNLMEMEWPKLKLTMGAVGAFAVCSFFWNSMTATKRAREQKTLENRASFAAFTHVLRSVPPWCMGVAFLPSV